jgi:hypothetical protein
MLEAVDAMHKRLGRTAQQKGALPQNQAFRCRYERSSRSIREALWKTSA